jgi:hypothetical protein
MRPEFLLNTCIAAMRLEGCGPEFIALLLAEGAVDALTVAGLRAASFDAGVEQLAEAMRERAAELRAAHLAPAGRPAPLALVVGKEIA